MRDNKFEKYAVQWSMEGNVSKYLKIEYKKRINENSVVLDVGCGDGKHMEFINKTIHPKKQIGLEVSKLRAKKVKKKGFDVVYYNGALLPLKENSFDIVLMIEVIEHIEKQTLKKIIEEIRRLIKPDGILIVTTPNYPIMRFYRLLSALRNRKIEFIRDDPTHINLFNQKKLVTTFSCGFDIIEKRIIYLQSKKGIKLNESFFTNMLSIFGVKLKVIMKKKGQKERINYKKKL